MAGKGMTTVGVVLEKNIDDKIVKAARRLGTTRSRLMRNLAVAFAKGQVKIPDWLLGNVTSDDSDNSGDDYENDDSND